MDPVPLDNGGDEMGFTLDMTMMFVVHDALRRELTRIARITARPDDDPRQVLRTAAGWGMFTSYLRVHHTAEDDAVWGVMAEALAGRPADLALLHAMEAEHAALDPLLVAIDVALADREHGPERLGGLVDALTTTLSGHLVHEEAEGLALVDATLGEQQWKAFSELHRARVGADVPRYLPWLLDDATPERVAAVLARVPEAARVAYRDEWAGAYSELDLWRPGTA